MLQDVTIKVFIIMHFLITTNVRKYSCDVVLPCRFK